MTLHLRRWGIDLLLGMFFLLFSLLLDLQGLDRITPDSHTYIGPAHGMLEGKGFAAPDAAGVYHPEFIRTPLYPVYLSGFLALFGDKGLDVSVWGQRLLWAMIVLFCFPPVVAAGRRRSRFYRVVGKTLALLSPQVLINASIIMTDLLFACWVAVGLFGVAQGLRRASLVRTGAGGLVLGLATLTRPVGQHIGIFLFAAYSGWSARHKKKPFLRIVLLPGFVLLIASLALPSLWCLRNYAISGHYIYTPFFGVNLAYHRTKTITQLVEQGVDFGGSAENRFARIIHDTQNALSGIGDLRKAFHLDVFQGDEVGKRVGMKALRLRPERYVLDTIYYCLNIYMAPADAQEFLTLLFGARKSWSVPLGQAARERVWGALLLQGATRLGGILVFLLVPIWLFFRQWREGRFTLPALLFLVSGLYFTVMTSALVSTYGRFLLPILPAILYAYCISPEEQPERQK